MDDVSNNEFYKKQFNFNKFKNQNLLINNKNDVSFSRIVDQKVRNITPIVMNISKLFENEKVKKISDNFFYVRGNKISNDKIQKIKLSRKSRFYETLKNTSLTNKKEINNTNFNSEKITINNDNNNTGDLFERTRMLSSKMLCSIRKKTNIVKHNNNSENKDNKDFQINVKVDNLTKSVNLTKLLTDSNKKSFFAEEILKMNPPFPSIERHLKKKNLETYISQSQDLQIDIKNHLKKNNSISVKFLQKTDNLLKNIIILDDPIEKPTLRSKIIVKEILKNEDHPYSMT